MLSCFPSEKQIQAWEKVLERNRPDMCRWLTNGKGLVCFYNYSGDDVELAINTEKGWATRQFITSAFHYTFNQLGCHRATVRIAETNQPSIKLVIKLGFQLEGILREAIEGKNVLIFGLLKRECRWIDGKKVNS